jgi:hypothetical protein
LSLKERRKKSPINEKAQKIAPKGDLSGQDKRGFDQRDKERKGRDVRKWEDKGKKNAPKGDL